MTEAEKANNAEALVGKNAMSGFLALMNAAPEDIEKVSGAVNNCKDAAKNMADTMQDNLEGQLTILKSQLQELAISFGDLLMPAVRSIVSGLQGMVDVLNAMPDGVTCDHDRCTSGYGSGACADHHRQDSFGHWNDYDMGTEACRGDQCGEGCFCGAECHDDGKSDRHCDRCHCSFSGGVYLSLEYK